MVQRVGSHGHVGRAGYRAVGCRNISDPRNCLGREEARGVNIADIRAPREINARYHIVVKVIGRRGEGLGSAHGDRDRVRQNDYVVQRAQDDINIQGLAGVVLSSGTVMDAARGIEAILAQRRGGLEVEVEDQDLPDE